jgi:hypothetical protein
VIVPPAPAIEGRVTVAPVVSVTVLDADGGAFVATDVGLTDGTGVGAVEDDETA